MNRVAESIKDARIKAGLSEKELAKKCGLSVGYIIQIESGKKIVKEDLAEKIFKSMGEKMNFLEPTENTEEVKSVQPVQVKAVQHATTMVNPNEQWADALSGVIKKYPVFDGQGKKIVEYKELPIISKRIEGHHPDKILFHLAPSDDLDYKRIKQNDILTLSITKEIENNTPYIFEISNTRYIGLLKKEGNKQVSITSNQAKEKPLMVDQSKLKIIGKCIKVEFRI